MSKFITHERQRKHSSFAEDLSLYGGECPRTLSHAHGICEEEERKRAYPEGEKRAMDATGASKDDVREATEQWQADKSLTQRQKLILQSGWPDFYGKPGTKFLE